MALKYPRAKCTPDDVSDKLYLRDGVVMPLLPRTSRGLQLNSVHRLCLQHWLPT